MRRDLLNRLLLGAVAVLVVAALADAVVGGGGAPEQRDEGSPDPVVGGSPADPPADLARCVHAQLDLLVEMVGRSPVITLAHVRGPECRTGALQLSAEVVDRRGRIVLGEVEASEPYRDVPPQRIAPRAHITFEPDGFRSVDWCDRRAPYLIFASMGGHAERLQVPCVR